MPHVPGHADLSAISNLKFVVEFEKPIFDNANGMVRVDYRVYYKQPMMPPGGTLQTAEEDLKYSEQVIGADYIIADLGEWVEPGSNHVMTALAWSSEQLATLADALGADAPHLGDLDEDGVTSAAWSRGFGEMLKSLKEEYARRQAVQLQNEDENESDAEEDEEDDAAEDAGTPPVEPSEAMNPNLLGRKIKKPAVDLTGIGSPGSLREKFLNETPNREGQSAGLFGDNSAEPVPKYNDAPCERVIRNHEGKGNSWIVLGRDRHGALGTGYGGSGDTQAFSMDLVVGRMASYVREVNEKGKAIKCEPDFINDASRIYISQKCDIDNYFNLPTGVVGNSTIRSAIGIKADGIRIVAREGIKLVTGVDNVNSQGAEVKGNYGIDLIAGNTDTDMQPIPKGANLGACILTLSELVADLAGCLNQWMDAQAAFNSEIMTHTHNSPFYALNTTPSIPLIPHGAKITVMHKLRMTDIIGLKTNIENFKIDYLSKIGSGYINSRYNNTN